MCIRDRVGGFLFVISPFALYFTPIYPATLRNPVLHELLHVHFLLVGCLFFWPLLGLDPLPGRLPYPLRMLVVFATLPFHAFLGVSISVPWPMIDTPRKAWTVSYTHLT